MGEKRKTISVHKLVLETFVGPCPEGMECRHLDGDKTNNCLDNLRWGTKRENAADQDAHGTRLRGEAHPRSLLTQADRDKILSSHQPQRSLARQFGVSQKTIWRIKNRKVWTHV